MSRKYSIRHETRYRYAADVVHSHHLLHLVPRPAAYQQCLEHQIDIEPAPQRRSDELDAFGNPMLRIELAQPHRELAVTSQMQIEVHARPAVDADTTEAWEKVRGPQLEGALRSQLTASRFAEQTAGNSLPSPASGESPMAGGSMFRTAAVAEGSGRSEQEGGTRAGDATGDGMPDPLLADPGERLQAQLKQAALSGAEEQSQEGDAWFYAESKEQKALAGWRDIQARDRFAQAQAGSNEGISIQHRQIVKEYFMNLREGSR